MAPSEMCRHVQGQQTLGKRKASHLSMPSFSSITSRSFSCHSESGTATSNRSFGQPPKVHPCSPHSNIDHGILTCLAGLSLGKHKQRMSKLRSFRHEESADVHMLLCCEQSSLI
jgi:hypothetical protein